MKFKGVIFDLDGVICFTDDLHYLAWKALADRLGIYFDRKINDRLRGVSRMESLDIVLERASRVYSAEEKIALATEKNATYVELLSKMRPSDVDDDVRRTLVELKEAGVKIAIGSSSKNARIILRQTGLEQTFDAISDGNNISRSKPDPEVFLKAADMLGLSSCDCLVVEDALSGIEAGKAGGFSTAGIGPAANFPLTDYALSTLSDLLPLVFFSH